MSRPSAAVDVGSNSVRCKVVDGEGRQLARELTITRLAAGIGRTGRFDETALQRTIDVIGEYRQLWRSHGVADDRVRIAATSAVRDAADRERFFAGVRQVTGIDAEVLTGEAEAAAAYRGVAAAIDAPRPLAVLDIGGGSTELVVGDGAGGVAGSHSMQLGSVRLTERFLHGDPPTGEEVAAAGREIEARLDELDERLADQGVGPADAVTLVGVAGTVTTIAALVEGLEKYVEGRVHRQRIGLEELQACTQQLTATSVAGIAAMGPVQPGREDVLAGGALIALAVLERYGFDELVVSEADVLDGLAEAP